MRSPRARGKAPLNPIVAERKEVCRMSIYHCSIKIGSRSTGRSACAASAYRAAEKIEEQETGLIHDYTRKSGVVHSEIMLPDNAPAEYADRATLWNAVQEVEKASNAQLFREVEVALPQELTQEQQLEVVRQYVKEQFVNEGMCADFALHDKGDGNPHAHIMLTTRPLKENGEWGAKEKKAYKLDENGERIPIIDPKTGEQKLDGRNRKQWERETVQANDWNDRKKAEKWREAWAAECNKHLTPEQHIDHRSYERQGIELEPTKHIGVAQQSMKEKGKTLDYDKTAINAEIKERNSFMQQVMQQMRTLYDRIKEKARALYEQVARASRDYGYVGATGELAYNTGTTAIRDRAFDERERRFDSVVREATGSYRQVEQREPEITRLEQVIKQKGVMNNDRVQQLLARANRSVSPGVGESPGREGQSKSAALRERADSAISNRENRESVRERLAAAERAAREREAAEKAARAARRSRGYEGPSL